MNQIAILSGKGGTGKTSITASFAVLAKNSVVADCDVDAPDLHMLLHPQTLETRQFVGSKLAVQDKTKCIQCGLCRKLCRFGAVTESFTVDKISCEGCGVCAQFCPSGALTLVDRVSGNTFISKNPYGYMSHALLDPGEANSGKLVTLVRQNAKNLAAKYSLDLVLIDGSPGIGCPVIASISGVNAALVVIEPTLSGIHDLERVLALLNHFKIQSYVCINMFDVNLENTKKIEAFCREHNVEVLGKIPFDPQVTQAMVNGKTIIEYAPTGEATKSIEAIWNRLSSNIK